MERADMLLIPAFILRGTTPAPLMLQSVGSLSFVFWLVLAILGVVGSFLVDAEPSVVLRQPWLTGFCSRMSPGADGMLGV